MTWKLSVINMAVVVGLNGQTESFAVLNNTPSNVSEHAGVLLHVNGVMSSNDSCNSARTCPLTDNGSSKVTDDVTPEPGYVIKASASGGRMKVFVNVCKKESIEKPSPAKQIARGGRFGLSWTIPRTLTEQVVDDSQYKQTYRVFDFQVHPDTCRMAETNSRFKNMLNEFAIGDIAGQYNVHLNGRKLQFPKMKYKGVQVFTGKKDASVLRGSSGATAELHKEKVLECCKQQTVKLSVDSNKSEIPDQEKAKPHTVLDINADTDDNNNKFTVPKYAVTCLANEEVPVVNGVTFSQMLVVDIKLPLVSSALAISLDVFEKHLNLTSTGAVRYKLEIDLPYVVDENHSFAKFVKSRKVLRVTMPVLSSSSICASSSKSTSSASSAGPGEILVSQSDVNTEFISTNSLASTEITSDQEADLIVPTKDEHAVDESVNCLTNMQFSHTQDLESVRLIFMLNGVEPSSVAVSFISDTFCRIELDKVVGDGGVPSHVCCFLKFGDDCKCKDDGYSVNVMDDSVVLVIAKASQCHYIWNTFWTGPDINHLEERQFFTSPCLTSNSESQDMESCTIDSEDKPALTMQVNSADDDKVLIIMEKSRNSDEDVSSEIVVVHEKGVPKLHGILKQRSVSESSDDGMRTCWIGSDRQVSVTTGSEGDDNEDSPDRSVASLISSDGPVVRKSVSFNDHIDRTLFQANQSVSSMHSALKNRRRRARKRDQKQEQREQRRRRRSSGSFSLEESGDEQTAGVQAASIRAEKAGGNSHISTEFSKCAEDRCNSAQITNDGVDGSFSNAVLDDEEVAYEKVFSSQGVLGSESSSGNGEAHENEKLMESALLKSKLALNKTCDENVNYSDALRTKNCLEDCGSEVVNDGTCNLPNVCDMSSVHVFGNDENCESDVSDMDVMCDGLGADSSGSVSQRVVSRSSDNSVELVKLSHTVDGSISVAGSESQPLEKVAVSHMSSVFDLDVD